MIQRIQSLYLLLVVLCMGLLPICLALWMTATGDSVFFYQNTGTLLVFGAAAVLALVSLFLFKNRQHQFVVNRLNIILHLFLLGFFVYRSLNLSGENTISEKGIGMLIPVFSIVFLVLANRAIKKDEDLVKSVDRLR